VGVWQGFDFAADSLYSPAAMFVFLDEAGDTGMRLDQGSSQFFTIALVIFANADVMQSCDRHITILRGDLRLPEDFEFHFHDNSHAVRAAFLNVVSLFEFTYFTFVVRKASLGTPGRTYGTKDSFYMEVAKSVFEEASASLQDAYVVIDRSGSRDFQDALSKRIKALMNVDGGRVVRKFRSERSSQNNLLQLADYVASICHRKASGKRDGEAYHRTIISKEQRFTIWP